MKERYYYHVTFDVPYDINLSKNKMWKRARFGRTYMNPLTKNAMYEIAGRLATRLAMSEVTPVKGKVWLSLHVYKPNHRSDAVNFIDAICDAVKDALNVDDRWFSITQVDWSIDKENPRISIGVGQKVSEDCAICSNCSEIRPQSDFYKKTGVCVPCKMQKAHTEDPPASENLM